MTKNQWARVFVVALFFSVLIAGFFLPHGWPPFSPHYFGLPGILFILLYAGITQVFSMVTAKETRWLIGVNIIINTIVITLMLLYPLVINYMAWAFVTICGILGLSFLTWVMNDWIREGRNVHD